MVEPIATAFQEVYLKVKVSSYIFLLIAIYATPTSNRKLLWQKLLDLSESVNLPWLLIRDFNEISKPQEKFGGRPPDNSRMQLFIYFLNRANLIDIGFIGPRFTWTNCRQIGPIVRTHKDRANANPT